MRTGEVLAPSGSQSADLSAAAICMQQRIASVFVAAEPFWMLPTSKGRTGAGWLASERVGEGEDTRDGPAVGRGELYYNSKPSRSGIIECSQTGPEDEECNGGRREKAAERNREGRKRRGC